MSNTGHITLNAKGYYLEKNSEKRPVVRRNIIEPFGEVFSTSGVQSQNRINSYTAKLYPHSSHGFGRFRTASDSAQVVEEYFRFFDSTCETRFVNDRRLPILEEDSTETGLEVIRASTAFKGDLWAIWLDDTSTDIVARKYVGSTTTWTDVSSSIVLANASVNGAFDLISHKDRMLALVTSTNDHQIYFHTTGIGAWTAATTQPTIDLLSGLLVHEDIDAGLLAEIGGDAVAILWHEPNGTITFFSSTNSGVDWTDSTNDIPSGNGPQGVAVIRGPDRLDKLIVASREGLWEVDTSAGNTSYTFTLIYEMVPNNDNGRRMTKHDDGSIWFAQGVSDDAPAPVFRLFVDANGYHVEPVPNSLHLHDGVPDEMLGSIRWMKSSQGFMYASIGGGKASRNARVICHNGKGWHSMRRHGTENEKIQWIDVSPDDDGVERLHYSIRTADAVSNTKFLGFPNTNPSSGVAIKRELVGFIDLPYMDGGMPLVPKAYLRIGINAVDLTSGSGSGDEFINVDYGVDDGSGGLDARNANDLGNFLSGTTTIKFPSTDGGSDAGAGRSSRNLGLRINLDRSTTNTNTPKLKDVEVDYKVQVPTITEFDFVIDLERTAQQNGIELETVISNLQTARDSVILVVLNYAQLDDTFVEVENIEFQESMREVGGVGVTVAANSLAQRFGRAVVTCKEILN